MRGSIAPEPEDFCIFICLNAALLGPPKPNSVLQSLVSICCTLFLCTFSNFPGGTIPPYKNRGGDVSPPSPPGSLKKRTQIRAYAFVRAFTCAQKLKMLQIIAIFFCIRFKPYGAFDKKSLKRVCARVFCAFWQFSLSSCSAHFSKHFDTMFIFLSLLITEWASVQDKYPCARAHVLHSIYGQKHAYKKYIGMNKDCQFLSSYLNWVWVGDMISCLIWPLSIFLHNHIDLGTQNTNLHIMTSTYLRKMIVSLQILINFLLNFDML